VQATNDDAPCVPLYRRFVARSEEFAVLEKHRLDTTRAAGEDHHSLVVKLKLDKAML